MRSAPGREDRRAAGPPEPTPEIAFLAGPDPGPGALLFDPPSAGDSRSFAPGASDFSTAPPSGSGSGPDCGSAEVAPPSDSRAWAGLVAPRTAAVPPPGLGPRLPRPGIPGAEAVEPLGLAGVSPVPGVTPIPEPSTYALVALGLGLVAGMARSRVCAPY